MKITRASLCFGATALVLSLGSPVHAQDDGMQQGLGPVAFLEWREIGPAVVGGRVSDIAVDETDTRIIYVGTATSGIWKSTNHGTTWEPIFTDQSTSSIGDVTLAPSNSNVVWVGTGEPQKPSELTVGGRRVQIGGRGTDVGTEGSSGDAPYLPDPGPPARPRGRVRGGCGQPLEGQPGTRRLQDDRRW